MTKLQLVEFYTKTTGNYVVSVSQNDFFNDNPDSLVLWHKFVEVVKEKYPSLMAYEYIDSILKDEIIVFHNKEEAEEFYALFNSEYFYSEVYTYICGPDGMIDENT